MLLRILITYFIQAKQCAVSFHYYNEYKKNSRHIKNPDSKESSGPRHKGQLIGHPPRYVARLSLKGSFLKFATQSPKTVARE